MARQSTERTEQLLVDVREQSVVVYIPTAVARRLSTVFGVEAGLPMPHATGMTLQVRKDTLVMRRFNPMKVGALPFAALRRSPPQVRMGYMLHWPIIIQTARCHKQPVTFTFRPDKFEGTLPPCAERTWYDPDAEGIYNLFHPARMVALRELRYRGPLKLIDIPGWAQNVLTPEERLAISKGTYWK